MSRTNSKSNQSLQLLVARLNQVQMSQPERIEAMEQLAKAEAAVEAVFGIVHAARQLLTTRVVRPFQRMTASFG